MAIQYALFENNLTADPADHMGILKIDRRHGATNRLRGPRPDGLVC